MGWPVARLGVATWPLEFGGLDRGVRTPKRSSAGREPGPEPGSIDHKRGILGVASWPSWRGQLHVPTHPCGSSPPTRACLPDRLIDMPSDYLPTLYKNRHANRKQHVCAICLDRTRGTTQKVDYGYGVSIHLCAGHASPDFQRQRGGRDLVLTLSRVWQANGCLTTARNRALDAHLKRLRAHQHTATPRQLRLAQTPPTRRNSLRHRRPPHHHHRPASTTSPHPSPNDPAHAPSAAGTPSADG